MLLFREKSKSVIVQEVFNHMFFFRSKVLLKKYSDSLTEYYQCDDQTEKHAGFKKILQPQKCI